MRIFIAGTPRTGSMWTYNVTRALLESEGNTILPAETPAHEKEEMKAIQEAYASEPAENTVYCIKTHLLLKSGLPKTKIITNYRDVRDTMISFIRFMQMEKVDNFFEFAKKILSGHMQQTDYFFEKHPGSLKIRFTDIASDPVKIINGINEYLGLHAEEDQILRIKEKFSKARVSKLIERLNKVSFSARGQIIGEENTNAYKLLGSSEGKYRVFDNETGFQTCHITSWKDGEWKVYFTPQQRLEINALVAEWLKKYNFPL